MSRFVISCVSCGQAWTVANSFSLYEQQAVESCPCPHCGAYTLCCQEPPACPPGTQPPHFPDWQLVLVRP